VNYVATGYTVTLVTLALYAGWLLVKARRLARREGGR
jgi:hypothetical protein